MTVDQQAIVTTDWLSKAREFASDVVRPRRAALDAAVDPVDCWSWEIIEQADAMGLRQAPTDPKHGGAHTDFVTNVAMLEEIAAADLGIAVVLSQHWKFLRLIEQMGTREQQDYWLDGIARNPRGLLAAAFTEPDAGSDNFLPFNAPGGGLQTKARLVGDEYVLSGQKRFISNGNRASVIVFFARTDAEGPLTSSVTAFLVPADARGLRIGAVHDKSGERLANNAELFLDDVRVPRDAVLGKVNEGMSGVAAYLRVSNAYAAACCLGIARECLERTVSWCSTRKQGGDRIINHQAVGSYLADMYMNVEVGRTYIRQAARVAGSDAEDVALTIIPKLFMSERTLDNALKAMELWGGSGVMRENGIEKLLRDAAIWLHSDGTNIILRQRLANCIRASVETEHDQHPFPLDQD